MNSKEKFLGFLEAIKTEENAKLIDNVTAGFNACCENKGIAFVSPTGASTGMVSNIPKSKAGLDVDMEDVLSQELPEEPNIGEPEVAEQASADIMNLVKYIKEASPEDATHVLEEVLKKLA